MRWSLIYMSMVAKGQQSFKGLIDTRRMHINLTKLWVSDFYGQSKKNHETKDAFANDLQVLARKIIAWKPSFHLVANYQLKAQYAHKIQDPYYALQPPGGWNIHQVLGILYNYVWKACKTELVHSCLCRHWDRDNPNWEQAVKEHPGSSKIKWTTRRPKLTACKVKMNS